MSGTHISIKSALRILLVGAGYGALLGIALFIASHSTPLSLSVDRVIAADNFLLILSCLAIICSVLYVVHDRIKFDLKQATPIDIALIGMAVESFGWIVHRSYWLIWRIARDRDYWSLANAMEETASLLTAIGFLFIVSGGLMVISPWTRTYFGKHWFLLTGFLAFGLWAVFYQAVSFIPSAD